MNEFDRGYGNTVPGEDGDAVEHSNGHQIEPGHEHHEDDGYHYPSSEQEEHEGEGAEVSHPHDGEVHEGKQTFLQSLKDASLSKKIGMTALLGAGAFTGYYLLFSDSSVPPHRPMIVHHSEKHQIPALPSGGGQLSHGVTASSGDASLPFDGPDLGASQRRNIPLPPGNIQPVKTSASHDNGPLSSLPSIAGGPQQADSPMPSPAMPRDEVPLPHEAVSNPFSGDSFAMIKRMADDQKRFEDHVNEELDNLKKASQEEHLLLAAIQQSQNATDGRIAAIETSQKEVMTRLQSVSDKMNGIEGKIDSMKQSGSSSEKHEGSDEGSHSSPRSRSHHTGYQAAIVREAPANAPVHRKAVAEDSEYADGWSLKRAFSETNSRVMNYFVVETPYGRAVGRVGEEFRLEHGDATPEQKIGLQTMGVINSLEKSNGNYYLAMTGGKIWGGRGH